MKNLRILWIFLFVTVFSVSASASLLSGYHVLFIAGIYNELIPGYFAYNKQVVTQELGATASNFFPPSEIDISRNAQMLKEHIKRLHKQKHKPIILFGHSKGGAEALYLTLQNPEMMLKDGTIDRVILVQAAIGGSPIAEKMIRFLKRFPKKFNKIKAGLQSLVPSETSHLFLQAVNQLQNKIDDTELAELNRRIFYVQSYTENPPLELAPTYRYLKRKGEEIYGDGRNDGLLFLSAQILNEIGTPIMMIKADHAAATTSWPLGRTSKRKIKNLTREIIDKIFDRTLADCKNKLTPSLKCAQQ